MKKLTNKDLMIFLLNGRVENHKDGPVEKCPQEECAICAVTVCPHKDPLHFHHDGCPSCYLKEKKNNVST